MTNDLTIKCRSTCLSDLRIDAYLAEELSDSDQSVVRDHAQGCARCGALLREREQERADYLSSAPALALQNELRRRGLGKGRRSWIVGATSALSVAAALLLMMLPGERTEEHTTRTKGGPQLGFFVKHGERVRRGADGERVEPGDRLRFTYSSERLVYLTILSFDPAGHASEYFAVTRMPPAREGALPSSVELDATLGRERIYGVFCQESFANAGLLTTLEKSAGNLQAPKDCTLSVVHIIKEPTR